jgi:hypothetical protein
MRASSLARWLVVVVVIGDGSADADTQGDLSQLADQMNNAWYKGDQGWLLSGGGFGGSFDKPAPCAELLDRLAAAGVPDTTTILIPADRPDLEAGKRTLTEVRKACEHIRRVGLVSEWDKLAEAAASEHPKLSKGGGYDARFFKNCVNSYDRMIKAGIAPTERVLERNVSDGRGGQMAWAGTVEELRKKWCDEGVEKAGELRVAEEGPYRKVLKNDKLKLALEWKGSGWILRGGATTSDPTQLAHADVWFVDASRVDAGRPTCGGGKEIHTVRRHQFDANHKLVKTTTHDYCGSPPSSAYR